jgi:hypothetical protein
LLAIEFFSFDDSPGKFLLSIADFYSFGKEKAEMFADSILL